LHPQLNRRYSRRAHYRHRTIGKMEVGAKEMEMEL
jgi:hypothetical protein